MFGTDSATQPRQGSAQQQEARGPWMKPGGSPRREFIPHTGNKHLLHHADPAVRHTRVWSEGGGGGKGQEREREIWQAGQDEPSRSDHDAQTGPPQTMEEQ